MIADQVHFLALLAAWLGCMIVVLWSQRKEGTGAGLVISYVLQLWVIHWLGAAIYALPWFVPPDRAMELGLEQNTYAIAGFAIGSTLLAPWLRRKRGAGPAVPSAGVLADPSLVHSYLLIGAFAFFVLEPQLHGVPTVSAVASAASNLLLVALGVECWNGLHSSGSVRGSFWRWVALSTLLPFVTIITKGYLAYGFAAMLTVFAFVASFYRPRWKMVALGVLVGYAALSIYVTYMRDRRDIRAVVWGQESYSTRLSTIAGTFTNFEFLNIGNPAHLARIDDRLNQNSLLGLAVSYLEDHPDAFANGRTLWEAALSPIPRILWPDKPMVAGSGSLVTEFTGITFGEDTSVGIGHIMEWYVNFGSAGVLFGMMGLGLLIGWIDRAAIKWLYVGDWAKFTLWWLPGLGLLQVGGSLVEAASSAGASLVVAVIVDRFQAARSKRPRVANATVLAPPRVGPTIVQR